MKIKKNIEHFNHGCRRRLFGWFLKFNLVRSSFSGDARSKSPAPYFPAPELKHVTGTLHPPEDKFRFSNCSCRMGSIRIRRPSLRVKAGQLLSWDLQTRHRLAFPKPKDLRLRSPVLSVSSTNSPRADPSEPSIPPSLSDHSTNALLESCNPHEGRSSLLLQTVKIRTDRRFHLVPIANPCVKSSATEW